MGSIVLLDLMGGVALLMWGLRMVRSGIMRAFGSELRRVLGTALRDRVLALLAGMRISSLLQSSTATGLLMTSFAARGLLDLVPALALMLGANLGTTLIVQALSSTSRRSRLFCFWRACWRLTSAAAGRSAT